MAVRRTVPVDADKRIADLPDHLEEFFVEDWVDPTSEQPPTWWYAGTVPSTALDWFQIKAWGRHDDALDAWAKEHGLTRPDLRAVASRGRPHFRNHQAFVALVKEHCL